MLVIIPHTTELVGAPRAQLLLERRAQEAVRGVLRDHGLAGRGRDSGVDLHALGARPHERRVRRVPHVLQVNDRLAAGTECLEHGARRGGRRLGVHQRERAAREVVHLDVHHDQRARHCGPPRSAVGAERNE
jgi:hypothetical protein